jgi:hypothetical protein
MVRVLFLITPVAIAAPSSPSAGVTMSLELDNIRRVRSPRRASAPDSCGLRLRCSADAGNARRRCRMARRSSSSPWLRTGCAARVAAWLATATGHAHAHAPCPQLFRVTLDKVAGRLARVSTRRWRWRWPDGRTRAQLSGLSRDLRAWRPCGVVAGAG